MLLCAVVLLALALMHWSLSFSGRELDSQEAWQAWLAGLQPYRPNGCLWASGPALGRP